MVRKANIIQNSFDFIEKLIDYLLLNLEVIALNNGLCVSASSSILVSLVVMASSFVGLELIFRSSFRGLFSYD